jgi:non-specific serine/threonine protein kinase
LTKPSASKPGVAECLERLGGVAGGQGHLERAARLLGAAEAVREAIGAAALAQDRTDDDRNVAIVRSRLDEKRLNMAWAEGRAMTLEQAIEYALAGEEPRVQSDTTG